MILTLIDKRPVIVTEGHKQRFKDFDHLVTHINRNGLAGKVQGLELLPLFWFNRIERDYTVNNVHEAHVAQLTVLS